MLEPTGRETLPEMRERAAADAIAKQKAEAAETLKAEGEEKSPPPFEPPIGRLPEGADVRLNPTDAEVAAAQEAHEAGEEFWGTPPTKGAYKWKSITVIDPDTGEETTYMALPEEEVVEEVADEGEEKEEYQKMLDQLVAEGGLEDEVAEVEVEDTAGDTGIR